MCRLTQLGQTVKEVKNCWSCDVKMSTGKILGDTRKKWEILASASPSSGICSKDCNWEVDEG